MRDEKVTQKIKEVHTQNYGVYGMRKIHAALFRAGGVDDQPVARCTVHRLMKAAGLKGISRRKTPRTTVPAKAKETRPDLVKRNFTAEAPNRLWVADFTYHPHVLRVVNLARDSVAASSVSLVRSTGGALERRVADG